MRIGHEQVGAHIARLQLLEDAAFQLVQTLSLLGGDHDTVVRQAGIFGEQIALVHDDQIGGREVHVLQGSERRRKLRLIVAACVADDEREIAMQRACQRRFERVNQMMRKILQKSNRIGQQKLHIVDHKGPGSWIKRRKESIFNEDVRTR